MGELRFTELNREFSSSYITKKNQGQDLNSETMLLCALPKLLLCLRFPRGWSWTVQKTQVSLSRTHSPILSEAHGHSLSVCLTQELFGRNGFEYMMFQMFESSNKDLLFSDDTECLASLGNKTTYEKFLGPEYLTTMANLRPCLHSGKYNGTPRNIPQGSKQTCLY